MSSHSAQLAARSPLQTLQTLAEKWLVAACSTFRERHRLAGMPVPSQSLRPRPFCRLVAPPGESIACTASVPPAECCPGTRVLAACKFSAFSHTACAQFSSDSSDLVVFSSLSMHFTIFLSFPAILHTLTGRCLWLWVPDECTDYVAIIKRHTRVSLTLSPLHPCTCTPVSIFAWQVHAV